MTPHSAFANFFARFDEFGTSTAVGRNAVCVPGAFTFVDTFVNEFWTSKQRAAHSLHEISYRACFKPQLPRFFIEHLTKPGDTVYDPFMGRGTSVLEAGLLGRVPLGCDINPLSELLVRPRFDPPTEESVAKRLAEIKWDLKMKSPEDLLVFYHPETLRQISSLKQYLLSRARKSALDGTDEWIRMVALNRLTGHSPGFFSVYTLPPNQAVSVTAQRKINRDRKQIPPLRDVAALIVKKTRSLLSDCDDESRARLAKARARLKLIERPAAKTPEIPSNSVALVVTSPPFLDVVDYAGDNWLRSWFAGIDAAKVPITIAKKLERWQAEMTKVFVELERILKPGGHIAFEVGEVRGGKIKLDEAVLPCAAEAGLEPELVLINDQSFTKTSNCWGVDNRKKGTNTNRVVLLRKSLRRRSR